jgi:pimeloyl-ACP methyl ester carboxylesterase
MIQDKMKTIRIYGKKPFKAAAIHGGPGAAGEMSPVALELSHITGVLEPLQTEKTIEGQIVELKNTLEKHAGLSITLIGFSWGAWLSLIFAAKHPDLVTKLILISSGPFEQKYAEEIQRIRLSRLNDKEKSQVTSICENLNSDDSEDKNTSFEKLGKIILKADAYDPISFVDEAIDYRYDIYKNIWKEAEQLRKSGGLLEFAKNIKCPVVAIHGDYDPHPAKGVQEPLQNCLNDFRFILLQNCGHKPWIEKHARERFYKILEKELG